jgi:hypothetical protein
MYHSHLLINVGDNPDRPDWRNCRRWLRNLYRVHQRLCMAFSAAGSCGNERETAYCMPFDRTGFPELRDLPSESGVDPVHQARSDEAGFLYRIDYPVDYSKMRRQPVILVQSANEPDWDCAFGLTKGAVDAQKRPIGNAGFLLAAPPQANEVSITLDGDELVLTSPRQKYSFCPGHLVRFKLRANPTRKIQDGSPNGKRKRVNPTSCDHVQWLGQKLAAAADGPFCLENFVPGWAHGWRTKYEPQAGQKMQWWSVLFEGSFRIKDTAALKTLLQSGIGPAKAFGFGLLSIAPG